MSDRKPWNCPPQVKDLPRDTGIAVTCRACGRGWGESVQNLIETHHMGVEFVDLLEWKYRCTDEACGGMVRMAFEGVAVETPARVAVVGRLKAVPRLPYPVKAVVKPRVAPPPVVPVGRRSVPQLSLPLGMP